MALAFLRWENNDPEAYYFRADTGTNKFYKYQIGKEKSSRKGMEQVEEVIFESPLLESQSGNFFQSDFSLKIPVQQFRHPAKYIQLQSFKNREEKSPAISKIVEIKPAFFESLPPVLLIKKYAMSTSNSIQDQEVRSVSFAFGESKLSSTMFWGAILQGVATLAPIVLPKLAEWLGKKKQGEGGKENNNQQLAEIIQAVMAVLNKDQTATVAPNTAKTASLSQYFSINGNNGDTRESSGFSYKSIQKGVNGKLTDYSTAQFFPAALIPLISAAAPLILKKAPDLLNAVGDNGSKLLNAINGQGLNGKKEDNAFIAGVLEEMNKQSMMEDLMQYLKGQIANGQVKEEISPAAFMKGLSVASQQKALQVKVGFKKEMPVSVNGKNKYVYLRKGNIKFLLLVEALSTIHEQPVPKSMVRLQVKDLLTGKLLLEKQYKFRDIQLNSQLELPVSADDLAGLTLNTDLTASASFSWMTKEGQPQRSEPVQCPMYLVEGAFLKGIGERVGEPVPLNDPVRHRNFWHKIYEVDSKGGRRWEINLDSKYYTYYKYDVETNGRVETKLKTNAPNPDEGPVLTGKLKSGMEVSPYALNKLIPDISQYSSLAEPDLLALRSDDMSSLQNQVAANKIQIRGKKEDKGMVWIYPEVTFHKVTIQKPSQTNVNGQVTETKDENVYFPRLSHIHFLSVKPASGDPHVENRNGSTVKLDGFDILSDSRITLMPVELDPLVKKV
jgi:hypothetical protein